MTGDIESQPREAEEELRQDYHPEPLAVVGYSCRAPRAENPEEYWRIILHGERVTGPVPEDRWDNEKLFHPDPSVPGRLVGRTGGFIDGIQNFDARFFGVSPKEAEHLDPQQRLLLETAWEALESAAIVPSDLSLSRTGVFVGACNTDCNRLLFRQMEWVHRYSGTSTALCMLAQRLSHAFHLRGPSMTIDTASSSALSALFVGAQCLWSRSCDLILVGGVNVVISPEWSIVLTKMGGLSARDGCSTLGMDSDGYVRGDACGLLVVKRLSDAVRHRDRISAVIRSIAVNHNGLTNGPTGPSGEAQTEVIRSALSEARTSGSRVRMVELSGAGNHIADRIEVRSLSQALGERRESDFPCAIGSVNDNIGHAEGAAGMMGLIKSILAIERGMVPPHPSLETLNPRVDLDASRLEVLEKAKAWDAPAEDRVAGVSSFGITGANAHAILTGHTPETGPETGLSARETWLLPISAKTPAALQALARRFSEHLREHPGVLLKDMCATAARGRTHFRHRLAVTGGSIPEMIRQLEVWNAFLSTHESSGNGNGNGNGNGKGMFQAQRKGAGLTCLVMGRVNEASTPAPAASGLGKLRECGVKVDQVRENVVREDLPSLLKTVEGVAVVEDGESFELWLPSGSESEGEQWFPPGSVSGGEKRSTMNFWELTGLLFVAGIDLDWGKVYPEPFRKVLLPAYPFERQRYWWHS